MKKSCYVAIHCILFYSVKKQLCISWYYYKIHLIFIQENFWIFTRFMSYYLYWRKFYVAMLSNTAFYFCDIFLCKNSDSIYVLHNLERIGTGDCREKNKKDTMEHIKAGE